MLLSLESMARARYELAIVLGQKSPFNPTFTPKSAFLNYLYLLNLGDNYYILIYKYLEFLIINNILV